MRLDEYLSHDACGLAALVADGAVSAGELLQLAQAQAAAVETQINAICVPMAPQAQTRVQQALRGPFAGVPFLIKDIQQDYAGVPTTRGSRATRDWAPTRHAHVVQRWLDAGLVIFGKTATPELALKAVTESQRHGPTRNPWNLAHTPGGSSGGTAAAVAAGIVPMAGASDGGGSIRIPAAYCGLFGLRPSRGRVPAGPATGEVWEGASSEHVLSWSVRDSAHMLDVLSGAEVGDPFVIAPPSRPYAEEIRREPGRLRIALQTRSPLGTPVDPEYVAAAEGMARLLESLGHAVEPAAPAIDGEALAHSYLTLYFGQVAAAVAEIRATTGADDAEFELDTRLLALLGRSLGAGDYVTQRLRWNDYARALGEFHQQYDLLLTPTAALPPARIGELDLKSIERIAIHGILRTGAGRAVLRSGLMQQLAQTSLQRTPFTQLANLTGTPAMSVPYGVSTAGLPIGVQFVARYGDEAGLLRLAAQLESVQPWAQRRPALATQPQPLAQPAEMATA